MQPFVESGTSVPAFLNKLWKMVCDPSTDHLISWSVNGTSFIIQNQANFWYELLPVYYKHNNMSSFVRQLNMYGFHKINTVDNGTMDVDKDEIQFYHPYFQKDQPDLLKLIKRKTGTKQPTETAQVLKPDELTKVLTDVKQLRGRQVSVDTQLAAMKQENAVLWRELAILRQKHSKQQQIVNKLIQFLVSFVNPSRMGVGVKRRYPLMLKHGPSKKSRPKQSNTKPENFAAEGGPIIHELDDLDLEQSIFENEDDDVPLVQNLSAKGDAQVQQIYSPDASSPGSVQSPAAAELLAETPSSSGNLLPEDVAATSENLDTLLPWDKPELVDPSNVIDALLPDVLEESLLPEVKTNDSTNGDKTSKKDETQTGSKLFLNTSTQDTLLSDLVNGSYNVSAIPSGKRPMGKTAKKTVTAKEDTRQSSSKDMTVATRKSETSINNSDDLDMHLENTQSELDQLKDILNGCGSLDANALLGLFNDEYPDYGLSYMEEHNSDNPLLTGSELAPYQLGFNELFDESLDASPETGPSSDATQVKCPSSDSGSINTPQVNPIEPSFPTSLLK